HSFVTSPSMMNYRRTTIKRIPLYQYNRTIVYYTQQYLPHLIFIQMFELSSLKKNELKYYLLAVTEQNRDLTELSTTIVSLNRCINITRLLNRTIMEFTRYKRVKFYQKPCRENSELRCFYDEQWMCLCNREHYADCFAFDHSTTGCRGIDYLCQNGGYCVQDEDL
ncbi:unnamed protein product, partial [Didymodactylos carnosus]